MHSMTDPDYIRDRGLDNLLLNDLVIRQEGIIKQATQELRETQAKLLEAEKRSLEHRITGGFAHERHIKKDPSPQYEAHILCLKNNDSFPLLLRTKREFLSIKYWLFISQLCIVKLV